MNVSVIPASFTDLHLMVFLIIPLAVIFSARFVCMNLDVHMESFPLLFEPNTPQSLFLNDEICLLVFNLCHSKQITLGFCIVGQTEKDIFKTSSLSFGKLHQVFKLCV